MNEFRFGCTQFNNDQKRFYANIRDVTGELGIIGLSLAGAAFLWYAFDRPRARFNRLWRAGKWPLCWPHVHLSVDGQLSGFAANIPCASAENFGATGTMRPGTRLLGELRI